MSVLESRERRICGICPAGRAVTSFRSAGSPVMTPSTPRPTLDMWMGSFTVRT
jgi:hypothetical protein